jgi:1,4-dihydroxy-2-naphthoyl-CoA hydrolase
MTSDVIASGRVVAHHASLRSIETIERTHEQIRGLAQRTTGRGSGRMSGAPDLEALVASMPHAVALGITLESASPDEVVGGFDWAPDRCTVAGVIHGGALMALADSVGAVCAFLDLPAGATTATTSSTTHFLRAVREGRVTATARPVHRGRSQVVVRTDLTDVRGRLVATVTKSQAVLSPAT